VSKTNFPNEVTFIDDVTLIGASNLNPMQAGIMTEIETRTHLLLDGVTDGFDTAISGSDVNVAAGTAYCAGKRYSGLGVVDFSTAVAGTYYVYIDPTNDAAPYQKGASVPSGALALCSVVSAGGGSLSTLIDLSLHGLLPWDPPPIYVPTVTVSELCSFPLGRPVCIEAVYTALENPGSSGSTTVDVLACASGGTPTTIFLTSGRRPTIASGTAAYSSAASGLPDGLRIQGKGNVLKIAVAAAATGASGLSVTIVGRYL
jgi:hypothetical protein